MHYLGIEIGGTKMQLGIGPDDGRLRGLWRGNVDVPAGPDGIRRQIAAAVPELLTSTGIGRDELCGVGIGFGGPVDDETRTVIKSHQIAGWDRFPLADWVSEVVGVPTALGNDADVAGLAEALHGAGKGYLRSFTLPSARGSAAGSCSMERSIEAWEKGRRRSAICAWNEEWMARCRLSITPLAGQSASARARRYHATLSAADTAEFARAGEREAQEILNTAWDALAEAISHVIALLCPRRIVIGGGVSLMGEELLFAPLRRLVAARFRSLCWPHRYCSGCAGRGGGRSRSHCPGTKKVEWNREEFMT